VDVTDQEPLPKKARWKAGYRATCKLGQDAKLEIEIDRKNPDRGDVSVSGFLGIGGSSHLEGALKNNLVYERDEQSQPN
jgi:hypothetical protein